MKNIYPYLDDWIMFRDSLKQCPNKHCPLWDKALHRVMPRGYMDAKIVFIGEAPGPDEDEKGIAFVGRSGKLLDTWIEELGLKEDYFITNVVKCFPYQLVDGKKKIIRPPEEAIKICSRYLEIELFILNPLIIVPLGTTAANYIMRKKKDFKIGDYVYRTIKNKKEGFYVHFLYHPSYYLRNHKKPILAPLKKLIKKLKEAGLWEKRN